MTVHPTEFRPRPVAPPDRAPARPTYEEALGSVRTLLRYIGEDPEREGLVDTPARVLKAYGDLFGGYDEDPGAALGRTFDEVAGYDGPASITYGKMTLHFYQSPLSEDND